MEAKLLIVVAFTVLYGFLFPRRKQMMFYVPILYQQVTAMLSLMLIEGGAYISEQRRFGFENGSFYVYAAFSVITLVSFYAWCDKIVLSLRGEDKRGVFLGATVAFGVMLAYAIWRTPVFNRFSLYQGDTEFVRFLAYATTAYVAAYIYCTLKEKSNTARLSYLIIFCFVSYLKAEEFSGYFLALYTYYYGYVIHEENRNKGTTKKYSAKNIAVILGVSFAVVGAVAYKFSQIPDIRFFYRVINQAHTFWGAIDVVDASGSTFDLGLVATNFFTIETSRLREDYGLGQLEYAFAGEIAQQFHAVGSRFAIGYPSILIFHFGYLAAHVLNVLITGMYVAILCLQMNLLRKYGVIAFILFLRLSAPFVDLVFAGEYANINLKLMLLILATVLWVKLWDMLRQIPAGHLRQQA